MRGQFIIFSKLSGHFSIKSLCIVNFRQSTLCLNRTSANRKTNCRKWDLQNDTANDNQAWLDFRQIIVRKTTKVIKKNVFLTGIENRHILKMRVCAHVQGYLSRGYTTETFTLRQLITRPSLDVRCFLVCFFFWSVTIKRKTMLNFQLTFPSANYDLWYVYICIPHLSSCG